MLPVNGNSHLIPAYYSYIDPERMKGWVGLVGWPVSDGLPTLVVTHQLQVERRTGKVRQSETDVLPLCHATNLSDVWMSRTFDLSDVWTSRTMPCCRSQRIAAGSTSASWRASVTGAVGKPETPAKVDRVFFTHWVAFILCSPFSVI